MTPVGAILDWSMGARARLEAFRDVRINAVLGRILAAWSQFLTRRVSRRMLRPGSSS